MKVYAIADQHGSLPEIPECDLLLIGGDIVPPLVDDEYNWLNADFRVWLEEVPAKHIVGVAGNHDFAFQSGDYPKDLPWHYLEDSGVELEGFKIWGSPWQPYFGGWAFNAFEDELEKVWELIPDDTDILVLHGPPFGFGDQPRNQHRVGSSSLRTRLEEINPKLTVFGHIHGQRGWWRPFGGWLANVTLVKEGWKTVYKPMMFDIEK